jgi:hypothetical protein
MRSLLAGLVAGLVTTGCAGAWGYQPVRAAPMSALTEEENGVCVAVDPVRSCLSTNRAGDPPHAFVETTLTSQDLAMAVPQNWRIVVTRDEGEAVLDQPLTLRGVADHAAPIIVPLGGFVGTASVFNGKALERVPPWRPGSYTIRYVYLPTDRRIELTVRLR